MEPSVVCTRVQKLCGTIRFQLQQLEDGFHVGAGGETAEEEARANLTQNLNACFQELSVLDRAINENGGQKREYYRKKAASLTSDALDLRRSVERYLKTAYVSRKERRDREQLLGGASDNVAVDAFLAERGHLASSHTMMDEISSAAENVMMNLKTQRTMLKGVHRKVLDVGQTLGLSNSLMKVIERRTTGDKVLVYGGMAVISLLVWLVIWHTR